METEGNGVMRCDSVRNRMQCGSEAATDKRGTSEHEDSAYVSVSLCEEETEEEEVV